MSPLLSTKLSAARRKHVSLSVGAGVSMAVGTTLAVFAATMLLDWWLELPLWVRGAFLSLNMAAVAYALVWHVIVPVVWSPDDDEVALWVEGWAPALGDRLIAAVQLSRPDALPAGSAAALVGETIRQAEKIAAPLDFAAVVKPDRFMRNLAIAGLILVLFTIGMARAGMNGIDLFKRAILVPGVEVPRKTRVVMVTPMDLVVARGDPVTLSARAEGIVPSEGFIDVSYSASGANDPARAQRYRIERNPGTPDLFSLTIDNVQASFEYIVHLGDGHSAAARITAAERPAAVAIKCTQIFPKYTGLEPVVRQPGDLTLVAGSRLAIDVTANKPVRLTDQMRPPFNRVHLLGVDRDVPLSRDGADHKHLTSADGSDTSIQLPKGTTGFSVHLVDEQNLVTKDPAVYRIDLVPDKPPALRITSPARREDLVTRRAALNVGLDVSDDFGVVKLTLRYRITTSSSNDLVNGAAAAPKPNNASGEINGSLELDVPPKTKSLRGYFPLKIDQLEPAPVEGQTIEWWIEAEDANNVTGPGKTASERFMFRVVTDAEKRADLMSRLGNYLGEINDVSESERELSQKLGQLITEKK
jgi:hypothetical protein